MDFEDQEEHDEEEEMGGLPPESYDTLNNSRLKMGAPESGVNNTGPSSKPKYKECLKNHAVGIGGHALDGCGEFMPAGPEGSLDGLKCAACNCHRNFHRKDSVTSVPPPPPAGELFYHHQLTQFSPYYRTPAGYLQEAAAAHRPLALPSTSGGHSREDQEDGTNHGGGGGGSERKRFRTKFTQEQKDKMLALAERLGWRIQRHDEGLVNEFCNETGVKRHVLKVWMHNNKHTLGRNPKT